MFFVLYIINKVFDFRNFFNPISYSTIIYIFFSFLGNCIYTQVELYSNSFAIFYISNTYLIFHAIGIYTFSILNGTFVMWNKKYAILHINKILNLQSKQKFDIYIYLLIGGSLLLFIHYIFVIGDIPLFRDDVEDFRVTSKAGRGQFLMLGTDFILLGCIIYALRLVKNKSYFQVSSIIIIPLTIFLLALSGYRSNSFLIMVIIFTCYQIHKKRYFSHYYTIFGIFVMFLFVAITTALRWGSEGIDYLTQAESADLALLYFSRSLAANTGLEEVFDKFRHTGDLLWGKSYYLDIITLLPGEQPNFGLWLKEYLGMNFRGGSVMINEAGIYYINFGYLGVAFFSFMNSFFLSVFYKYSITRVRGLLSLSSLLIIGLTVSGLGDISTFLYTTSILLFLNYFIFKIFSYKNEHKMPSLPE